MNGVLSKLTDAASMFWLSLDDEQRRLVTYAALYLAVTVALGVHGMTTERREAKLRRQIVAELRGESVGV